LGTGRRIRALFPSLISTRPLITVRFILGITLLLIGVGLWSCQIDGWAGESSSASVAEPPWVRTADGWERATWLATPPTSSGTTNSTAHTAANTRSPQLHPIIVAAAQLLISLLALCTSAADRPTRRIGRATA
jgi:hypothetical protein